MSGIIPKIFLFFHKCVFKGFLEGDLSFWEYQNKITCKDGSTRLVQWKNFLRRDSENNPIAIHSEGNLI